MNEEHEELEEPPAIQITDVRDADAVSCGEQYHLSPVPGQAQNTTSVIEGDRDSRPSLTEAERGVEFLRGALTATGSALVGYMTIASTTIPIAIVAGHGRLFLAPLRSEGGGRWNLALIVGSGRIRAMIDVRAESIEKLGAKPVLVGDEGTVVALHQNLARRLYKGASDPSPVPPPTERKPSPGSWAIQKAAVELGNEDDETADRAAVLPPDPFSESSRR